MLAGGLWLGTLTSVAFAQKVKTDHVRSIDFGKYRTYAWKPGHALGGSEILPVELLESYVRPVVTRELNAKGLKEVAENADVFVTFFVGLDEKTQAAPLNNFDHYGRMGSRAADTFNTKWNDTMVYNYQKGVLLIDLVDAATKDLVWRAYCRNSADRPGDAKTNIDAAAKKAFKDFPPKK